MSRGNAEHMNDPTDASPPASDTSETSETSVDVPVEGSPSDNTTLIDVLSTWSDSGFDAQFIGLEGARIECTACGAVSDAAQLDVVEWRRLEGASDPDDMLKAVAAYCPACRAGGSLVLGYGVNASEDDAEISQILGADGDVSGRAAGERRAHEHDERLALDPDAPGSSLFRDGDAVEPNEPG